MMGEQLCGWLETAILTHTIQSLPSFNQMAVQSDDTEDDDDFLFDEEEEDEEDEEDNDAEEDND